MRTYPPAGKKQRIPLANGMDGPLVIAFSDLSDIKRNVDFSRAGLPAWGQAFVKFVEVEQAFGHGFDFQNAFGAGSFASAASHAFFLIHNRITFRTQFDGIKKAGLYTVTMTEAADFTLALAVVKQDLCAAAVRAAV